MQAGITFNDRVVTPIGPDGIRNLRDVLGISRDPAAIDEDFVNAVVRWQASQRLTQDGQLGPRSARPLFREIGAEGVGRGEVEAGPTYNPGGTITPPVVGGNQQATFRFSARFKHDPANGVYASCCDVRQHIRWDAASAAALAGGIPHAGFPAGTAANTWIEDRELQTPLRPPRETHTPTRRTSISSSIPTVDAIRPSAVSTVAATPPAGRRRCLRAVGASASASSTSATGTPRSADRTSSASAVNGSPETPPDAALSLRVFPEDGALVWEATNEGTDSVRLWQQGNSWGWPMPRLYLDPEPDSTAPHRLTPPRASGRATSRRHGARPAGVRALRAAGRRFRSRDAGRRAGSLATATSGAGGVALRAVAGSRRARRLVRDAARRRAGAVPTTRLALDPRDTGHRQALADRRRSAYSATSDAGRPPRPDGRLE